MIPTPAEARALLGKYNQEAFHLRHGETVSFVLGWFAQRHDPGRADFWRTVGMLHDVDFERFPERHCVQGEEILRGEGVDESVIRAAMSHGWGMTDSRHEPESVMEKTLFAVDELTGLIGAAVLMRPSQSAADLELSSLKKKFKDKRFAAGCSRETIARGAELLGVGLDELLEQTIHAMRAYEQTKG
jgi:predicted hydrolase (HD superfamily)